MFGPSKGGERGLVPRAFPKNVNVASMGREPIINRSFYADSTFDSRRRSWYTCTPVACFWACFGPMECGPPWRACLVLINMLPHHGAVFNFIRSWKEINEKVKKKKNYQVWDRTCHLRLYLWKLWCHMILRFNIKYWKKHPSERQPKQAHLFPFLFFLFLFFFCFLLFTIYALIFSLPPTITFTGDPTVNRTK